jgi:hypothetical protein
MLFITENHTVSRSDYSLIKLLSNKGGRAVSRSTLSVWPP